LSIGGEVVQRGGQGVPGDLVAGADQAAAAAVDDVADGVDERDVGLARALGRDHAEEDLQLGEVEAAGASRCP
jgi:hypothetical protein